MRQQAMPPSGPMMRAQGPMMGAGGYQQAPQMVMGARSPYNVARHQRPPNVSVGPEGLNIGGRVAAGVAAGGGHNQEWRHMMMSQQQSMNYPGGMHPQQQQQQMRPNFNPQQGSMIFFRFGFLLIHVFF